MISLSLWLNSPCCTLAHFYWHKSGLRLRIPSTLASSNTLDPPKLCCKTYVLQRFWELKPLKSARQVRIISQKQGPLNLQNGWRGGNQIQLIFNALASALTVCSSPLVVNSDSWFSDGTDSHYCNSLQPVSTPQWQGPLPPLTVDQ